MAKNKEEIIDIEGKVPITYTSGRWSSRPITVNKGLVKSTLYPVIYPDGKHGTIAITKVTKDVWQPSSEMESIRIVWK